MISAKYWTECRVSDGGVGEETEGADRVCSPMGGATVSTSQTPGAPSDWTTNKRVHIEGPMTLATYVADDGLM